VDGFRWDWLFTGSIKRQLEMMKDGNMDTRIVISADMLDVLLHGGEIRQEGVTFVLEDVGLNVIHHLIVDAINEGDTK